MQINRCIIMYCVSLLRQLRGAGQAGGRDAALRQVGGSRKVPGNGRERRRAEHHEPRVQLLQGTV